MAKQAADKAELDKMAQAKQAEAVKEVVAETTAEGSVATADAAAAAEGSLGAVSGEAAVAEAGAAGAAGTAAAISPLAIGAGVVGVVAVAAAAGGGSSGGSSSQPIAQNNTQQAAQNQGSQKPATPAAEQPAQDAKPAEASQPAQDAKPAEPAKEEPAKPAEQKPAEQPKVDPTPVEDLSKPATAGGTAELAKVAPDGVTNLTKFAELFKTAGANGGEAEFIKITRVFSTESTKDADARVIDYDNHRAYEVIDAGKPITLAEAQEMAAKLGGKLMSVDSAAEKAWLDKNLFGALGEYDGDKSLAEAAARGDSDKAAQQKVLDGQLASNGAWLGKNATEGADAKANAVIRNGNNAEGDGAMKLYEAAGTTLSKFVIEYEGYKSPLLLDGKPVVEGTIINKADAAKLAWNADLNKGGQITYQAVDSNDANAQPVANAKEGKMTLSESADVKHPTAPATNPAQNPQQGGAGTPEAQDNKGQAGGEDQKAPEGGNKTGNPPKGEEHSTDGGTHKADAPQNNPTGGDANKGNTNPGSSDTGGAVVKPNPAGEQHTGTPDVQTGGTVNQPAQPPVNAAPSYEPNKSVSVAHDATDAKIAKEVFEGTNPANKPEAVKATGFAAGTLKVNGAAIADGDKIAAENFDKVTWDASKGEGGSFKFTPVQANGDALQGATEQTITINEASAPVQAKPAPTYDANKTVDVAHDATDAKIAKEVFEGTNPANKPEAVKATGFAAGTLKVNGAAIADGDKIAAENFDKVTWDASKGEGGSFKFTPVQANGDALQGATEQTITINEASAPVQAKPAPTYDANKTVDVAHDATDAKIAKEVFEGTNPANKPEAVKATGFAAGTLKVNGAAIADGDKIAAENFDKVTWDASKGEGGSFKFTPVQANGDALQGATEQTITINEASAPVQAKPAPTYDANKTVDVAHDATDAKIAKEVFEGTNPANKPEAVKATGFAAGTLKVNGAAIADGDKIAAENFDKVTWDASKGEGGSFKFTPVQANGDALQGATEQTITINEASAPVQAKPAPTYDANKTVDVAHDATDAKIAKEVFEGTNPANKPEAVKATGFAAGTLKVNGAAIADGDKIAAENFDKVTWDASKGEGGSFKFTPVQANGDALQGATEQTITINEASAAPAPNKVAYAGHDVKKAEIGSKVFEGSDGQKPEAVKISGLTPDTLKKGGVSVTDQQLIKAEDFDKLTWDSTKGDGGSFKFTPVKANGDAIEGATEKTVDIKEAADSTAVEVGRDAAPLTLDKSIFGDADAVQILTVRGPVAEDRTNANVLTYTPEGGQKTPLTDGAYLDKANFEKVQWDAQADANNAGTYRVLFKPVTAGHEEIPGAEPKEIKVHEATGDLDYSTSPKTVNVETHDGTQMIPEAVFKGTGATPLYVWFKESTETDPTGSDRTFLKLAEGSSEPGKDLSQNAVISIGDLGKVQWDAAHNNGGTIRFQALDGDQKPIGDWQTIRVTESSATPQGSSEVQALGAADVLNPQGVGAHLKSMTHTPAEPSSNLLDDLHNQITPLI